MEAKITETKTDSKKTTMMIVGALVIALVFGFGGYKIGASSAPTGKGAGANFANSNFGGAGGAAARGGANRNQGGVTNGEVLSKDDKSLTVKMRDGGSKIIFFSTSTEISKFVSGNLSDVIIGTNVMTAGKTNADGSITAQTIQIRPTSTNMFGTGNPAGNNQAPVKP